MLDETQNIEYQASLLTNSQFDSLPKEDSSILQNTRLNNNSSGWGWILKIFLYISKQKVMFWLVEK